MRKSYKAITEKDNSVTSWLQFHKNRWQINFNMISYVCKEIFSEIKCRKEQGNRSKTLNDSVTMTDYISIVPKREYDIDEEYIFFIPCPQNGLLPVINFSRNIHCNDPNLFGISIDYSFSAKVRVTIKRQICPLWVLLTVSYVTWQTSVCHKN